MKYILKFSKLSVGQGYNTLLYTCLEALYCSQNESCNYEEKEWVKKKGTKCFFKWAKMEFEGQTLTGKIHIKKGRKMVHGFESRKVDRNLKGFVKENLLFLWAKNYQFRHHLVSPEQIQVYRFFVIGKIEAAHVSKATA